MNFTIGSVAASKASNRFMIVFSQPSVLPVTFTKITATQQNNNIKVTWDVTNQLNIRKYIVERSANGDNFTYADTVAVKGECSSRYPIQLDRY
ncbi:MAG: hypothetical protein WDM71_05930 [Ferruginibacter sp.]